MCDAEDEEESTDFLVMSVLCFLVELEEVNDVDEGIADCGGCGWLLAAVDKELVLDGRFISFCGRNILLYSSRLYISA